MRSSPLNNQRTSLEDIELVDSGNSPSTSLSHTRASIAAKSVIFANALAASKKDKKLAECSKPVQCFFSPIYFLISFILEILPEYTMSPLFAIFWYGYKKGLNVIRHRYLFPRGDSKAIPLSLMLILWVLDTCQWIAAYKFFTESEKMRKNGIDLAEFVVFMVTIALRSAVISTKYAYFSKEELQALLSPNGWDDVKAAKKMLLAGWCGNPRSSELLEECLETACDAASVNLSKATFTMVSPCGTSQKIISAKHLMGRIVYKCFGEPLGNTSKSRWCWVFLCALSPNLLRWTTANPWGEGNFETNFVVLVFFATNIIFGFNTLAFVVCSEHDFKRRRKAACLLSDLISSGGVAVEDFFSNNGRESAGDVIIKSDCLKRSDFSNFGKVFFDIRDANNAYSWMLLRSSLRIYGANYYERCQLFISYYLAVVTAYLVYVNIQYWGRTPHFGCGLVQMVLVSVSVGVAFMKSLKEATALQDKVSDDRLLIKKELLLISREIISLKSDGIDDGATKKSKSSYKERLDEAREFLQVSDDLIQFEEEEKDPTAIAGVKADSSLVNTCVGTFISLALFAYEGHNNSDCSYDDGFYLCDAE